MTELHVIEPTLRDQTGHCHSFVQSLRDADPSAALELWIHRDAGDLFPGTPTHAVFGGRLRRFQQMRVLRRLLRTSDRMLVATATRTDLMLLSIVARRPIAEPGRVFAYVHWFRDAPDRRRFLARMARHHPGLEILCPTESVRAIFAECGFPHVRLIPYPRTPRPAPAVSDAAAPAHVLFAGAARADKGFADVVDLVERLRGSHPDLPVTVQCSPTHKGRHPPEIVAEVRRLASIGHERLRLIETTLDADAYAALFEAALVVQPYDAGEFADRVSGVALDALTAGCPMVAPAATWMGRCVERFGAGVTTSDATPLRDALPAALADWPRLCRNAAEAARTLSREHDARRLLDAILGA